MAVETTYIKALVTPQTKRASTSRRVWSIDLETVWLPFFTATNVMGDTAIPHDALGAPLRLGYNKDGTVKFSQSGKPVIRVAKDLSDSVRMIRDNFTAGLMSYANAVATENPEAYKVQATANREAGMPIISHDNTMLQDAYATLMAEQLENELRAKAKADQSADSKADVMPEPSADKQEPVKEGKKRKSHRTPKAQAEKPAMRAGQSPADVPADQSLDTSNADHATPEREPTREPALVS